MADSDTLFLDIEWAFDGRSTDILYRKKRSVGVVGQIFEGFCRLRGARMPGIWRAFPVD